MLVKGFDWDEGNKDKNEKKHGVTYLECEEVFFGKPLVIAKSPKALPDEERFTALGKTYQGRLLCVVFTMRGHSVRVISARPMSRKERRLYEKG